MASREELLREAQHAFNNVSPGSTDERKNIARAKKYATRIVRKFPGSIEATQAGDILRHFDAGYTPANLSLSDQPPAALNHQSTPTRPLQKTMRQLAGVAAMDDEWRDILQRFGTLPPGKLRLLWVVAVLVFVFPLSLLGFLGMGMVYALNPPLLKRHLLRLLQTLDSKP